MFAASKSGKSAAAAATDPSFPYVPLLLETTSTNGQQNNTFLDSSTNNFTITRNGTTTQGSVTPYWPNGYWSNYFNGSTDGFTLAANAAFAFGTGAFTYETWFFCTGANSSDQVFYDSGAANTAGSLAIWTSVNVFTVRINGLGNDLSYSLTSSWPNQWHHLAVVRNGSSTLSVYLDGTRIATGTRAQNVTQNTPFIAKGTGVISGYAYSGYLSNTRIVSGSAVYDPTSATITVPTTPLTPITNTALLTCQSNRFIDTNTQATAKTITVVSTPKAQAFQPFSPTASYTTAAYGGSGYFNGSSDWLSVPDNAAFALGSGDFTAECWIYPTSFANEAQIMGQWSGDVGGTTLNWALLLSAGSTGYVRLITSSNGSSVLFDLSTSTTSFTLTLNSWQHIAAVRSGTAFTIYINGVSRASTTNASGLFDATNSFTIGAESNTQTQYFTGYISNARLVKGTAVYTTAFTPPTSPVTAISGTSLLTNFTNAGIYDAAVQNNQVTVGDAQSSTTVSKWSPTSTKFDGTGDWLTAIDSPQLQLGTGDFTIDGWLYLSANGAIYGIISKGAAATGWSVNVTVLNKLQFSYTASNLTGTTSLAASTWYYFAVVRSGSATGNLKLYLNGSVEATSGGAVTDNFNQTNILYVGADRVGATPLNGYLQDVRITKLARTITTPTAAFPTR